MGRHSILKIPILLCFILVSVCLYSKTAMAYCSGAFYIDSYHYQVDNQEKNMDIAPYILKGRTYVPIGFMADILGLNKSFDPASGTCSLSNGLTKMQLKVGDNKAVVNGSPLVMDVPPVLLPPGRIMLPARWVAQAFGWQVSWDGVKKSVTIFYPGLTMRDSGYVNVRQGPGLTYSVIATLPRNTNVTAVDAKECWLNVVLPGNKRGWVASWVISRNTEAVTPDGASGNSSQSPPANNSSLPSGTPVQPNGNTTIPAQAAGQIPLMKVCLDQSMASLSFSVNSNYIVQDQATLNTLATLQSGTTFQISSRGTGVQLTGPSQPGNFPGAIQIVPVAGNAAGSTASQPPLINLLTGNKGHFRGSVLICPANGKFTVVNDLPLEEYLYGVVPSEMPASWPAEALKAQAVTARTFALAAFKNRSGNTYYLDSSQSSQVYGGYDREQASTTNAVDSTRGTVLTWNGQLIEALYCASDGGYTENSSDVWDNAIPYLLGKQDTYDQNGQDPYKSWQVSITADQLVSNLNNLGYSLDRITSLQATAYTSSGKRIKKLQITGIAPGGSQKVVSIGNAENVRELLGLRGAPLAMQLNYTQPQAGSAVTAGIGSAALASASQTVSTISPGNTPVLASVNFSGSGNGHDVGMSQYGALGMAMANMDFRSILQFYYSGVSVQKNYGN